MAPLQYLEWFEDNITWFEDVDVAELQQDVPNCPGWTVQEVLNHLSYGLGLGYPAALSQPPDADDRHVFDNVARPQIYPVGAEAQKVFAQNMRECLATFRTTDPERPVWTYAGPGVAQFWFRRAAVETTLHLLDVQEALGGQSEPIAQERVIEGIDETIEFALPMATRMVGEPSTGLTVSAPDVDLHLDIGHQPSAATISGPAQDVLTALWGRSPWRVQVSGTEEVAAEWLALIERAFAGR